MSLAVILLGTFVLGAVFGAILQAKTHWITKSEQSDGQADG